MKALDEGLISEEQRLDAALYQDALAALVEERGSDEELKWWPMDLGH